MPRSTGRRGPRVVVVLEPDGARPLGCDAVVRAVRHRGVAVGSISVVPGMPPVIEVCTPAYSLRENREHLLARAYRAALAAADDLDARRIAVPTELTTQPWPFEPAIRVALGTLESTPTKVSEVVVVTRTPAALEAWSERLARR